MSQAGFELFEHTADLGVRAWARTLAALVPVASAGFYATIGQLVPASGNAESADLRFTDDPQELLLRDYLAELLYHFDSSRRIVTDIHVRAFEPGLLQVTGVLRAVDEAASRLEREVKAVTYHDLTLTVGDAGVELRFIVDI